MLVSPVGRLWPYVVAPSAVLMWSSHSDQRHVWLMEMTAQGTPSYLTWAAMKDQRNINRLLHTFFDNEENR